MTANTASPASASASAAVPAARPFAHLHCHTHYSLLDGANRIPELVAHVKAQGMNACAITDHGNLYGAIEFYEACRKAGINPVVGYEAYIAPGSRKDKSAKSKGDAAYHLTLLAKNETGFRNLVRMASIASLEGYHYSPRIDKDVLKAHREGVVCLSGCASGEFSDHILYGREKEAEAVAAWFRKLFGEDFYIEIQDNGLKIQKVCREGAVRIADRQGIPLVATSDAHYLTRGHATAHDTLLCINTRARFDDEKRMRYGDGDGVSVDRFHVCAPAEMYERMPMHGDAIRRSQQIADGCDLRLDFGKRHFPAFAAPEKKTAEQYLRELCERGMRERYEDGPPAGARERLEFELDVVCRMGFASYFLVVWDFVDFGRRKGIPSGARGSAVGAIISYLLYLSHVCPIKHGLLFERFLDPNRPDAPDIDIDLCQDRRGEVIEYVREKYGEDSVAQIITFNTLSAKSAVRDVGYVYNVPLADADRLAKMIPEKVGTTLQDTLELVPEFNHLYNSDPRTRHVIDMARLLEGTNKSSGIHAAGVVIGDGPLCRHVPLQRPAGKDVERAAAAGEVITGMVTQWDMGVVEKVGLLKMDFLGLRTLTLVEEALRLIRETTGVRLDIHHLPEGDKDTFDLISRGDTLGVFQLDSSGIRELVKRMKPDRIGDLIAIVALYRPGPLDGGMVDDYVNRKHGREEVPKIHPILDEILTETYAVLAYQEQNMQILNRIGGIELAKAYKTIKAISKKKQDEIDARRDEFIAGAKKNDLSAETAEQLFSLIQSFGGYGFNKSHATAYADLCYKTAYLKTHYPEQHAAALLTSNMSKHEDMITHLNDVRRLGTVVLPPDVNASRAGFSVCSGSVLYGLRAIRGVGESAAAAVVAARAAGGPFADLRDFCDRVDPKVCGKAAVEKLVRSGAADSLLLPGEHRAQAEAAIDRTVKAAKASHKDASRGQTSLFAADPQETREPLPKATAWSEAERLRYEKEALGVYLSGHPLAQHADAVGRFATHDCVRAGAAPADRRVVVAGTVVEFRTAVAKRPSKDGCYNYARFKLEDTSGTVECVAWADVYGRRKELLVPDACVWAVAQPENNRDRPGLIVSDVFPLEEGPKRLARGLAIRLLPTLADRASLIDRAAVLLARYKGGDPRKRVGVYLVVVDASGKSCELKASPAWDVAPQEVDVAELESLVGAGNVEFVGHRRPA